MDVDFSLVTEIAGARATREQLAMIQMRYSEAARLADGDRLPVLQSDAHALPFVDRSFEVVVLFEAIYYLADPERFVQECRRVLVPGGTLLLSTANREWTGFTSSALATRYLSASELCAVFTRHGFSPTVLGAFPDTEPRATARNFLVSIVRRAALTLGLVPATLHGREFLKRLFYGPLTTLGPEIGETDTDQARPEPISLPSAATNYKVLFAVGQLAGPH